MDAIFLPILKAVFCYLSATAKNSDGLTITVSFTVTVNEFVVVFYLDVDDNDGIISIKTNNFRSLYISMKIVEHVDLIKVYITYNCVIWSILKALLFCLLLGTWGPYSVIQSWISQKGLNTRSQNDRDVIYCPKFYFHVLITCLSWLLLRSRLFLEREHINQL